MSAPTENPPVITLAAASHWLQTYGRAWETGDADLILTLFTQDASYRETPFDAPMVGHGAIKQYWQDQPGNHRDVKFTYEIWAIAGDQCFSNWTSKFIKGDRRIELDGAFRLIFRQDVQRGPLCHVLEEWWHEKSALV